MKVLKATHEQFESLNNYTNGNNVIRFFEDANDNWIVGKNVLTDDSFLEIREQLNELEEIDFEPIVMED